ncbi:MAG: site-2 protease family protein [Actinomycetota bacterium]|jgi:Zn-dependent protease|nr:site-2 protease family protein [Actinomycetota bacterium]
MIDSPPPAPPRRSAFHQYGPWVLGLGAILAVAAYELLRRHDVTRNEVLFFVALVPSIILHEISHGLVAYWCGDDTAKRAKRLSLNPLRHVDPVGTILLPIILIATVHQAFGWARPVPIDVSKLRHPRNQAVLVGLVGPLTNILIALAAGFALRFASNDFSLAVLHSNYVGAWPGGYEFLFLLGEANAILAAFNLIPLPPLDGSAILERFVPTRALPSYYRLRSALIVLVIFVVLFDQGALAWLFDWATRLWTDIVAPGVFG